MDAPSRPQVEADPRVRAWLELATARLADAARERVTTEIVDHVADAAAERCATGAAADEAVARAVDALGDAARAGRALRRANLTRSEAKMVGGLAQPLPRWTLALYLLGLPGFVAVTFGRVDGWLDLVVFGIGALGIVSGIVARFTLARRLARSGRLRAALVADVFGPWVFYASLVVGSGLIVGNASALEVGIYLAAFVLALLLVARVWPKVGRGRPRTS